MRIFFTVRGNPQPKGSMRAFMPRGARFPVVTNDNKKTKPWQDLVGYFANTSAPAGGPWSGPVQLNLSFWIQKPVSLPKSFFWATKKPDLDKLARAVKDALKGIIYVDDAQVVRTILEKNYGDAPGVDVEILRLEGVPAMQNKGEMQCS